VTFTPTLWSNDLSEWISKFVISHFAHQLQNRTGMNISKFLPIKLVQRHTYWAGVAAYQYRSL